MTREQIEREVNSVRGARVHSLHERIGRVAIVVTVEKGYENPRIVRQRVMNRLAPSMPVLVIWNVHTLTSWRLLKCWPWYIARLFKRDGI